MRELRPIPYVNLVQSNERWTVPDGYWLVIANTTQVTIADEYGGFTIPTAWMVTSGQETGLPRVWGGVVIKGADGKSAQVFLHPVMPTRYSSPCMTPVKKGCGCG